MFPKPTAKPTDAMMKAKRLDHTGVPAAIAYYSAKNFAAARAALSLIGNSGASVEAASR
ncbi:MAG: Uncharacterised protein [Halieaceae bacterium]|nr:MAG: Uncharacterised protein [Halieaceae bacterium]